MQRQMHPLLVELLVLVVVSSPAWYIDSLCKIIDTVELFKLPGQRNIALRFLAAHVLKIDVQVRQHM